MKQFVISVAFCMSLLVPPGSADVPHQELLDGLRRDGMADLAIEYLDLLAKRPPPGWKERIPLERAKALIDLAELQDDEKKRDDALNQARKAFDDFLKVNQDPAIGVEARLDLAKLIVRQGRYRISAARRQDNRASRQTGMAQARVIFEQAAKELATAATALKAEAAKPNADRAALDRRVNEIEFEQAVLKLNRALTYDDQNAAELAMRTTDIENVRKAFQRLSEIDPNDPLGWQAFAWVGRCWMELDNLVAARRTFEAIEKEAHKPAVADAARTARFYQLQLNDKDPNVRNRVAEVQRGCEDWLNRYRRYLRTPEGLGVQFLLATNLIAQAQTGIQAPKAGGAPGVSMSARQQLVRAEKLLQTLSQSDSEYTRKATSLRADVLYLLTAERALAGIERLNTFEECYLVAQVEHHQMSKVKDGLEAETERAKHLRRTIQALQRGLSLAGKADSTKDLFDARLMLSYMFLLKGDPYSAAVLGEHLTRTAGRSPRGAKAGVYALTAYATILNGDRARNAPPEEIAADKSRIRKLASEMERQWPNEPETDEGRFQLGELFFEDRDYPAAFEMYHKIKESFPAFAYARYRQGAAAQIANSKDFNPTEDGRYRKLIDQAIADLSAVGYPPPGAAMETLLDHFRARLQLGTLYQLAGQTDANYENAGKVGAELKTKIAQLVKKDDPLYAQLETEAERLQLTGTTGRAYVRLKAGQYDEAGKLLEPLLANIDKSIEGWKKSPNADKAWFQQFLAGQRDVVLLRLRADLQEGRTQTVAKAVERVQALTPGDQADDVYELLLRIVLDLKGELKTAKDTARQLKLEEGLVGFLDELAAAKDLSPVVRITLSQGYSAVDRHEKAAALLASIPAVKADADEQAQRLYRYVRLTLAKEYRLAKEFAQAKSVLREVMGTQAKKAWGYDNFDVRREAIALLDDEGAFGGAVQMALAQQKRLEDQARQYSGKSNLAKRLREQRDTLRKQPTAESGNIDKLTEQIDKLEQELQVLVPLRERYFEFYFCEVQSVVKSVAKANDEKVQATLGRIAIRLADLEKSQPDLGGEANRQRFAELLQANEPLHRKYVAAGGTVLKDTATTKGSAAP